jgi:hypothetical protein
VRRPSKGPEVTIAIPATGETIEAQFEEDGFQMLWLATATGGTAAECRSCYRLPCRTGGASRARHPRSRPRWTRTGSDGDGCSSSSDKRTRACLARWATSSAELRSVG